MVYFGPPVTIPLAQLMSSVGLLAEELDKVSLPPQEHEHAELYVNALLVVRQFQKLIDRGYLPSPDDIKAIEKRQRPKGGKK